ncbi:hypothetical protein B0H14DRAFT_3562594 [Mycena olivaceomarginata]|nr:hypothetical protein B0H14DRAFT_3562594 [Mycena olivaceomarginata]
MGRKKRSQLDAAARARQGRYPTSVTIEYSPRDPRYTEETEWTGGVNHCLSDTDLWETESSGLEPDTDLVPENSPSSDEASDLDHDLELLDMDDAAVVDRIMQEQSRQAELWRLSSLKMDLTRKEWKKVEANRSLGYNGQSRASQYRHAKHAREKAAVSAEAAKTPQAKGFASFFQRPSPANLSSHTPSAATSTTPANPSPPLHPLMSATPGTTSPPSVPTSTPVPMYPVPRVNDTGFHAPVYGYLSDVESSESDSDSGDEGGDESETRAQPVRNKRRKLDVPVREQVRLKKEKRAKDLAYRQNVFIPAFDRLRPLLVEYDVNNLQNQVVKLPPPPGEFQLILTPHDEMTAQANDADKSKWVLKGEMPIRKKGVGRGIHRSDIICSTVGHIDDAEEGMEYGNNYELCT